MNQLKLPALLPVAQRYAALVLVWTTFAVAGCSGNKLPSAALATPKATLDTARQAMADSDFETFCECLTDDAVYDLAGMLRGMYELSQKFAARPGSTPRKTEEVQKAQKMIAFMEKYMPTDAPQPKPAFRATAEERRARRREAGKAVRKPKEFVAEVLKLAAASQKGDAAKTQFTVIDVQVDGETANAKVNRPALGNQELPVTLRREDGVWKIDDWEFVNAMTIDPAVVKPSDSAFTKPSADKVPDVPPASMKIPEVPVSGTIAGREFKPDWIEYERSDPLGAFRRATAGREPDPKRIVYENIEVTMRQGKEFFADLQVKFFVHLKPGEKPFGKKWLVDGEPNFGDPIVYVSQMREGDTLPKTDMADNYALWLEFGEEKAGNFPGSVFLRVPGGMGANLAGTFVAELKNEAEQPPQQ